MPKGNNYGRLTLLNCVGYKSANLKWVAMRCAKLAAVTPWQPAGGQTPLFSPQMKYVVAGVCLRTFASAIFAELV